MDKVGNENIVEAIINISGRRDIDIFTAKVTAVDEDGYTIDVEANGVQYGDVRLMAVSSGVKGLIMIPKKESFVTVGRIEKTNQYVVLNCSKIEKVIVNCENIVFNDGDNAGLVKIKELEDNLKSLKKYCEDLKLATSNGLASTYVLGSAIKVTFEAEMATKTITLKNMENEKIKH